MEQRDMRERSFAMHQIGDSVVYGIHGICTIVKVEMRTIDRKQVEYFVLEPAEQPGARFYVPTQNQAAVAKLRKLLTAEQIDAILTSDSVHQKQWVDDENKRKQYYRELLSGGDRSAILCMINNLYRHKQAQAEAGRKFHLCDENFLHDAEKLLTGEAAIILNLDMEAARTYLRSKLKEDA